MTAADPDVWEDMPEEPSGAMVTLLPPGVPSELPAEGFDTPGPILLPGPTEVPPEEVLPDPLVLPEVFPEELPSGAVGDEVGPPF